MICACGKCYSCFEKNVWKLAESLNEFMGHLNNMDNGRLISIEVDKRTYNILRSLTSNYPGYVNITINGVQVKREEE